MTVEDRLHATTDALSGAMREVRPLTLPSRQPDRVVRAREPGLWRGWLVPLAAAVAVVAVAVALVAVRDGGGARPAPAQNSAATAIPRYYVQLGAFNDAFGYQRDVIVGDSRTGKVLATVKPAAHLTFAGVTGAADDRTFVIDATSVAELPQPNRVPPGTHTWYLLRIAPGTRHAAELTRLPIAAPANSAGVDGLALSPDARTLAVVSQADVAGTDGPFTLRTFSLSTGKALRTWTAPAVDDGIGPPGDADNDVGLTWMAGGRTLAFMFPPANWPDYERTLNVTGKGTSLLKASRSVLAIPNNCLSLLLASDGRTMVCGTENTHGCSQQEPQFNLYSTATGKLTRVLYRYQGTCWSGGADVVWAGAGGTAIGLIEAQRIVKNRATINYEVGVLTPGKFTPLHVPMPAGYFMAGNLAF
jgi:hypothetical protein